jgi:transposase-like protein
MCHDNGTKSRRQFSGETKWQILKEGRNTNLSVSEVCDHHQISPTQFYQWERTAERAARQALQGQPRGRKKLRPSEEALLAEIERLREVIAELSSENLRLKKGRW